MTFNILTLFPDAFTGFRHSILKRAVDFGKISINCVDIRDFAENKHKKVDDYPYGGGAGMVLMPQPIYNAYKSLHIESDFPVIYMSPKGRLFNQKMACELASQKQLTILCGHYEGVDQRILDKIITHEVSIGDYVLTGGETAAVVLIDAVARLIPGVISEDSLKNESFLSSLLEYPQYTRPYEFLGEKVPEVLLSGNHGEVEKWRKEQSINITMQNRPDIVDF